MKLPHTLTAVFALLSSTASYGALIIDIVKTGDTATLTASGTLDTSGLTFTGVSFAVTGDQADLNSNSTQTTGNALAHLRVGDTVEVFSGLIAPNEAFIPSNSFLADSFSGDTSLFFDSGLLFLESGTTSTTEINFTHFYDGLDNIRPKPVNFETGTYEWTWSSDKIVVNVTDSAAVPEPSSVFLIGLGGSCLIFRRKRLSV